MLTRLNDRSRNILTVEDPVEYYLDGIGQVPVNPRIDMSFARGLRAILRQDPDGVMGGEIRDLETAQIAVQASLTGHLVLSTLHTNTAAGAVTRLRDMGIEPFLLASSLIGVIAQRLVRKLCPHCKRAYTATASECALLGIDPADPPTLHAAVGCPQCLDSGYRGRSGVYDLVLVDETLRGLIHDGAAEAALEEHARRHTPSLFADGRRRLLAGDTSLDELLRVTQMQ
jgi:general secretion pathway protein E